MTGIRSIEHELIPGVSDEATWILTSVKAAALHQQKTNYYDRYIQTFTRINEIALECISGDWEGNTIPPSAFNDAREFLYHTLYEEDLSIPEIDADDYGAISFDWLGDDSSSFGITFYGLGKIGFSGYWGESDQHYGVSTNNEELLLSISRDILRTTQKDGLFPSSWKIKFGRISNPFSV